MLLPLLLLISKSEGGLSIHSFVYPSNAYGERGLLTEGTVSPSPSSSELKRPRLRAKGLRRRTQRLMYCWLKLVQLIKVKEQTSVLQDSSRLQRYCQVLPWVPIYSSVISSSKSSLLLLRPMSPSLASFSWDLKHPQPLGELKFEFVFSKDLSKRLLSKPSTKLCCIQRETAVQITLPLLPGSDRVLSTQQFEENT